MHGAKRLQGHVYWVSEESFPNQTLLYRLIFVEDVKDREKKTKIIFSGPVDSGVKGETAKGEQQTRDFDDLYDAVQLNVSGLVLA